MGKKILVAGAGHGGLTAAAQLAKAGFQVTVVERHEKENLGYDWFDALNPAVFAMVGCPHPEAAGIPWQNRADVTYFGPTTDEAHKIPQRFSKPGDIEITMERRDLYKLLTGFAEDCGVTIDYGVTVTGPLMAGDRVVGLITDRGDYTGDLVIDAAGLFSAVRMGLPDCLGIQKTVLKNERIYTYRAFYDLPVDPGTVKDVYKVMFRPDPGRDFSLSWIYTRDTYTDLLIGHMEPPGEKEIEEIAERYRRENPQLGKTKLRGGQTVPIPFRRPLAVLVADGYAAIGDAAFMTMPLNCSGISTSIEASKILAENMAPIALVKDMIIGLTAAETDYAFNTGLITWRELTITADQHSIWQFLHFDPKLPRRGLTLAKDPVLLKKAAGAVADTAAFYAWMQRLPKQFSRAAVQKWARGYDKIFTHRL